MRGRLPSPVNQGERLSAVLRRAWWLLVVPVAVAACSGNDFGTPTRMTIQVVPASIEATHPLDGLTPGEFETVRSVLQAEGHAGAVPYVALDEPDKAVVLAWKPGQAFGRRAFAVVRRDGKTFEAVVDLRAKSLVSWTEKPGALPGATMGEYGRAPGAAQADARFLNALKRRGLAASDVVLLTFAGGSTNAPEHAGRRLAHVVPYRNGDSATLFSRPVEGVSATVDLDTGEVLSVEDGDVVDQGAVPVALARRERPPLEAVSFSGNPNVHVDGSTVQWGGWAMHWRGNRRSGVEIADVRFDAADGNGARRVMYEASLGDLFVPYQSSDPNWSFRTLLDSAEFGMGSTLSRLQPGVDCPTGSVFSDVSIPDDSAMASTKQAAVCAFERPTGNPSYRHNNEGAPESELVLRWISVVGNYDYIVDYVFGADGSVRFHVFAAGIVLQANGKAADGGHQHGNEVSDGLLAINHDHYINFRLDLDVGATDNRLVRQHLVREDITGNPERTAIWAVDEQVVASELGARYTPDPRAPERVLVQSSLANGPVGHHPGYEFDFGDAVAVSSLGDDPGQRRGGWAADTLWATPYAHDERFASGLYVPDGSADAGLPAWTAADRSIKDTDLVLWFTVGFHHVVRTEDLPNMPAHESEFGLKPADTYAANPLLG